MGFEHMTYYDSRCATHWFRDILL